MSTVYSQSQPTKEHVTILAIPDSSSNDQSQQVSMSQSTSAEICSIIKLPDSNDNNETSFGTGNRISKLISSFENPSNKSDVVEIFDSSKIYSVGSLRVSNTGGKQKKGQDESKVDKPSVSEPVEESQAQPPLRSSLRNYNPKPQTSHHDSPKILKFEDEENGEQPTRQRFIRNSQRKSKITDAYFDALEDYEDSNSSPMGRGYSPGILRHSSRFTSPASIEPTSTLLVFPDDEQTPMGIEVTGIQDELGKLTAIQIIKIQEDGRVAKDGRLRVGDNILEIDGRPVYQMSMIRARAYLSEFTNKEAPSLSIERNSAGDDSYDWKRNDSATNIQTKPILSLLQQANTQQIGKTQMIELEKSPNGFGFTVTGRDTASGERLFYIGTVKPHGVALGHLQGGDRLLEINGESTAKLSQADIVERLKNAAVGETVKFLISRVAQNKSTKEEDEKSPVERENEDPLEPKSVAKSLSATISERAESSHSHSSEFEDILLTVPLNDTGSAGLGVSLKARVSVKHDGSRYDCGIFIKNVMHGGAAHKDGRLRVNDRIVGIEDIDFTEMTNSAASEAITKKLKAIGPNATHVRLKIRRSRKEDASFNMETVSQASNRNSRRESEIMAKSLDESELINSMNAFDREAPYRKSLSERRGMGASTDPNHIKLFQEIKHQRQTSAPSRSVEHEGRARSASVHPKGSDTPQHIRYSSQSRADARIRRSLSYDREPNISSVEFGDNERAVLGATSPLHPFPPGTPIVIEYRNGNGQITGGTQRAQNRERSVEKGRRKSVGSAMKSFFGIGSKSRDASPEKSLKDTSSISKEEERRRVVEHYDRLRRNEENGTSPQMQRAAKDSISRSQSDYRNSAQLPTTTDCFDQPTTSTFMGSITVGPSYSTSQARPQIPYHFYAHPNPLPLILGNSRFYCSERPSKNTPAKLTTGRSADTGTGPFLEQRTTSGMTAPGTQRSALDTAPISMSNKVGDSLRRLPHQALSTPNTEYDDHPYEMPRGMRYPYTDVRRLGMATPSDAVDPSPTIQEIPPAPSTRTHSLMSSTAPPVPPRLAIRKVIQTSPASTENITALSHRHYSQAACPVPTTATCSTPGSRTAERDDQADISIRPILRQPTGLRRTTPSYLLSLEEAERAAALGQQDEVQQSPSSQFTPIRQEPPPYHTRIHIEPNQSPQPATTQPPSASSTQPTSMPLIAFPNTRHAFMATLATPSQPRNTQERLSVRARKKVNRQSMLAKT